MGIYPYRGVTTTAGAVARPRSAHRPRPSRRLLSARYPTVSSSRAHLSARLHLAWAVLKRFAIEDFSGDTESGMHPTTPIELMQAMQSDDPAVLRRALGDAVAALQGLTAELEQAKARHRQALLNVIPEQIVDELIDDGSVEPVVHDDVTVVFTDFVGFTEAAARMAPAELVDNLDFLFAGFDRIIEYHGLEKLKTIGDAYMFAAGLSEPCVDHAQRAVEAAMDILDFVEDVLGQPTNDRMAWPIRVGLNSGPVVAGVVGRSRLAYDVWGDTVNVAARLESTGVPGRINISAEAQARLGGAFHCIGRGMVDVKGKGPVPMFLVEGRTPHPQNIAPVDAPCEVELAA